MGLKPADVSKGFTLFNTGLLVTQGGLPMPEAQGASVFLSTPSATSPRLKASVSPNDGWPDAGEKAGTEGTEIHGPA